MKKGLIMSIIGCVITSIGVFLEMHADKEDIRTEFKETYETEMRRIAQEEYNK